MVTSTLSWSKRSLNKSRRIIKQLTNKQEKRKKKRKRQLSKNKIGFNMNSDLLGSGIYTG